jgi:hypothetical protein
VITDQLDFWPEYNYRRQRTGDNAIYVTEIGPYSLEKGWLWKWLTGKEVSYGKLPPPVVPPPQIMEEFASVTDLGQREVKLGKRVFRRVQLFECRDLRWPGGAFPRSE